MTEIPYNLYKVANIEDVEDSKKVAGAIFFDDTTRCIYVYGSGGVIKRYGARVDAEGNIWANGIIDDLGFMYAFPGSSQEIKDNADFILQEKIGDLDDIREEVGKIDGINELVNDFNSDISYLYHNKQDKVYVLDFTLQDIYDVYYNGAQKQCLGRATLEAVQSGRQIVIKYNEGNSGNIPVNAYTDDALYINIVDGIETIMVEIYAYHEELTGIYQENIFIETITNPIIETPNFLNNESLLGLPFGYVGGVYGSYLVDTTDGAQNIDFGLLENYYYGNVAIYWYDKLYQFAVADLRGSGQNIGTALIQVSDDNHLLGTFYVGGLKKIFSWRTFTNRSLLPTDWVDGDLEGRINENTSAIESLQNDTVQKSGDVMTGTLTAPKFIGELEGNATSADVAKELSGHIEATEESFNFRASAGNKSIKDENARIEKVNGNSLVWNQKFPTNSRVLDETSTLNVTMYDGVITANGNTGTNSTVVGFGPFTANSEGVKYLFILQVISNIKALDGKYLRLFNRDYYRAFCEIKNGFAAFVYSNTSSEVSKQRFWGVETGKEYIVDNVTMCAAQIDLTQMFGAGNEPTTVEEFYERMPKGVDLNAYNEGEIINGNYGGIKTTGFNQFNQSKAEYGSLSEDGTIVESSTYYTGLINVLPNTDYYLKDVANGNNTISGAFYDSEMNCISPFIIPVLPNTQSNASGSITTPQNSTFMRVVIHSDYISTCCVNLIHSGIRNGEYEPYKEFTHDLSWIKKYFHNGMRSAGTVRDKIRFNSTTQKWEAVQNVGAVDLGELPMHRGYNSQKEFFYFYFALEGAKRVMQYPYGNYVNQINSMGYTSAYASTNIADMQICVNYGDNTPNYAYLRDDRYSDADTYKNAVKGQLLHYELAEPIVTEITDVVDMTYNVYDFGTEELLVAEDESSTPFNGEIVYQFNAVDRIRDNERNINVLAEEIKTLLPITGGTITGALTVNNISPIAGDISVIGSSTAPYTAIYGELVGNASSASKATNADTATKASQDGNGNVISDTYIAKTTGTSILLANGTTQSFNNEDSQSLTTQVASVVSVNMGILANNTATISLNQTKFNTLMAASTTKIFTILNGVQYVFSNACKEIVNSGRIVYSQMFFASADTNWPFKMFKMEVTQQGTSSQYIATATIQNIDMTVLTSIAE